ncbi:MAG: response regulator [Sphingomicrobium sp.]
MHALIIEDEPLIAIAIEDALRDYGFTSFDRAENVEEAVAAAVRTCPDLITADVQLHPGSGIEAVKCICSKRAIPVVFITGSPLNVRRDIPSYPLVLKPFSNLDLESAINLAMPGRCSQPVPANGVID